MKCGGTRRIPATGSYANGPGKPMKLPRVSISWPAELREKLTQEALQEGIAFAEVVRRRVAASYLHPVTLRTERKQKPQRCTPYNLSLPWKRGTRERTVYERLLRNGVCRDVAIAEVQSGHL